MDTFTFLPTEILASFLHPLNADFLIVFTFFPKVTFFSPVHPSNVLLAMELIFWLYVTFLIFVQFLNAEDPIVLTLLPIVIFVRFLQFSNALELIEVTCLVAMLLSLEQLLNALLPIVLMEELKVTFVIFWFPWKAFAAIRRTVDTLYPKPMGSPYDSA